MSVPAQFVGYLSHLVKNYLAETWLFFLLIAWFFIKSLPTRLRAVRGAAWPIAQGRIETVAVSAFNTQKQIATADLGIPTMRKVNFTRDTIRASSTTNKPPGTMRVG